MGGSEWRAPLFYRIVGLFYVEGDLCLRAPFLENARRFFFGVLQGRAFNVKQFIFEFEGDRAVAAPFLADNRYPRTQQARF